MALQGVPAADRDARGRREALPGLPLMHGPLRHRLPAPDGHPGPEVIPFCISRSKGIFSTWHRLNMYTKLRVHRRAFFHAAGFRSNVYPDMMMEERAQMECVRVLGRLSGCAGDTCMCCNAQ